MLPNALSICSFIWMGCQNPNARIECKQEMWCAMSGLMMSHSFWTKRNYASAAYGQIGCVMGNLFPLHLGKKVNWLEKKNIQKIGECGSSPCYFFYFLHCTINLLCSIHETATISPPDQYHDCLDDLWHSCDCSRKVQDHCDCLSKLQYHCNCSCNWRHPWNHSSKSQDCLCRSKYQCNCVLD